MFFSPLSIRWDKPRDCYHKDKGKELFTPHAIMRKQYCHGMKGTYSSARSQKLLCGNHVALDGEDKTYSPWSRMPICGKTPSPETLGISRKRLWRSCKVNLSLNLLLFPRILPLSSPRLYTFLNKSFPSPQYNLGVA